MIIHVLDADDQFLGSKNVENTRWLATATGFTNAEEIYITFKNPGRPAKFRFYGDEGSPPISGGPVEADDAGDGCSFDRGKINMVLTGMT